MPTDFDSDVVNECYHIYVELFYQNIWSEGNFVKQEYVEKIIITASLHCFILYDSQT